MQMKDPYIQGQGAAAPGKEEATGALPVRENTSPALPPVPQKPQTGMRGIVTLRTADNLDRAPA